MKINPELINHLNSFDKTIEKAKIIFDEIYGEIPFSNQAIALFIVLLERIEQLEKRLDANGIYQ